MESEEKNSALSRDATIVNDLGLHARSAARIAQIAGKAMSKVWVVRGDEAVDAKSTIDLLTLACAKGSEITIKIDREEDIDILEQIVKTVEDGFGEQIS